MEQEVVSRLVEYIIVDLGRLVQEDLLAIGSHRADQSLVFGGQIIHVEVFVFDVEDVRLDSDTGVTLFLKFKYIHAIVVTCSEVVQGGVSSQNPVSIRVLASLVNLHAAVHVPEPQGPVFGIRDEDLHARVEHDTRHVIGVALEGVHLPVLVA